MELRNRIDNGFYETLLRNFSRLPIANFRGHYSIFWYDYPNLKDDA